MSLALHSPSEAQPFYFKSMRNIGVNYQSPSETKVPFTCAEIIAYETYLAKINII